MAIEAKRAYYIKLGRKGEWESGCLRQGTLRLGYRETDPNLCARGKWERVKEFWSERRGNAGAGARDANQIRTFYEAAEDDLFITFSDGLLHWCKPRGAVEVLSDRSRLRATADGWHSQSVNGNWLSSDRISGHLLKVQMFQGTICQVRPRDYLLRKINDQLSPEVAAAESAERALASAIVGLLRLLTPQDFELLVDLVFSTSGWRRVGEVGRVQKTVDIELVLPSTGERALVQVKSTANNAALRDYAQRFDQADLYDRMFFVWHSGNVRSDPSPDGVTLLGPERLSQMVVEAGLSAWLREKVA